MCDGEERVQAEKRSVLKAVYSAWEHSAWHSFWQLPGNSITVSQLHSFSLSPSLALFAISLSEVIRWKGNDFERKGGRERER